MNVEEILQTELHKQQGKAIDDYVGRKLMV
jgi:hypothetical protein